MERTVAETIKFLSKRLIDSNKGIIIGQCLSAVGWVQNTVPAQKKGIVELPMTDVAGAGFAVGASLANIRPIFILRFQSFLWLNASPLINHAAEVQFASEVMSELVGKQNVNTNIDPTMGAEDFAFMLLEKPGCYVFLGNGDGDHRSVGHGMGPCHLHNPSYDFNDKLIPVGVSYWVKLAQRYLEKN
jgi:metal-dependent amidase/aminoacylase/carboxypeptidase family protein